MGDSAGTSVRSAALLWRYLAHVLVQDSLELVGLYPDQRVHIFLMANPEFVKLLNKYHADKKTGVSPSLHRGHSLDLYQIM